MVKRLDRAELAQISDLDLLAESNGMSLFDISRLAIELEVLLGVPVDIGTDGGLRERNRDRILAKAVPV